MKKLFPFLLILLLFPLFLKSGRISHFENKIPFQVPKEFCNVALKNEPYGNGRYPYKVIRRMTYRRTKSYEPIYLDIRVFDIKPEEVAAAMLWQQSIIEGPFKECGEGILGRDEKRALFLLPLYRKGKLYLLYSETDSTCYEALFWVVNNFSFLPLERV